MRLCKLIRRLAGCFVGIQEWISVAAVFQLYTRYFFWWSFEVFLLHIADHVD